MKQTMTDANGNTLTVTTNNNPRPILYGWDLTDAEKKQFDYLSEDEINDNAFFRYRGNVYHLGDIMRLDSNSDLRAMGWDGYTHDTYFSGIVVKYADSYGDDVIIGRYFAG